jgi:hypothetical protein
MEKKIIICFAFSKKKGKVENNLVTLLMPVLLLLDRSQVEVACGHIVGWSIVRRPNGLTNKQTLGLDVILQVVVVQCTYIIERNKKKRETKCCN